MTKILVADKFEERGIAKLQSMGLVISNQPELEADQIAEQVEAVQPDILIVRGTKVNRRAIEVGKRLKLIVRAGAGYDSIDVQAASENGIYVVNCPGKNSVAVAELTWGLILACDRRIPDQHADLRNGTWNKKIYSQAQGLKGRTLGIVGMGQIGLEVARRGMAFGMNVVAWSRSLTNEKAKELNVGFCPTLIDLAAQSDIVSVNVAASPETEKLIDDRFVNAMRKSATLINTSRGSVVDQSALAKGIETKGLRLGLDVFADEPNGGSGSFADPIIQLSGVYGTHHVGASTDQAQMAIGEEAVRLVKVFIETGEAENCVNLALQTPATTNLTVRHRNQPGVLAHVFSIVGQAGINVEKMENIIYQDAQAATARIQLDAPLSEEDVSRISQNTHVLAVDQSSLG